MDFLAQVIADLATLVTFQQRRTPAPPRAETDETACRLLSLPRQNERYFAGLPGEQTKQSIDQHMRTAKIGKAPGE